MRIVMKLSALIFITVSAASVTAQVQPGQTKGPKEFAQLLGIMIETCPIKSETNLMMFKYKQISAGDFVKMERVCPTETMASIHSYKKTYLDGFTGEASPECRKAVDDLYIDMQVHLENFEAGISESIGQWKSRITSEVASFKTKATRARLQC